MRCLLVLVVAILALASPGHAEVGLFRRFMESVMGSDCGAFGCKRDVEVSRAVRDYAQSLRDANDMMERSADDEGETEFSVRDLHERLVSFAEAENDLVQQVREQSRRLADYAKRALEKRDEEDPIQKTVRSIMDYAEEAKREEVKRTLLDLHEDIDDLKRRDADDMELRSPFAFARRALEEDEDNRVARALSDLYEALEE